MVVTCAQSQLVPKEKGVEVGHRLRRGIRPWERTAIGLAGAETINHIISMLSESDTVKIPTTEFHHPL